MISLRVIRSIATVPLLAPLLAACASSPPQKSAPRTPSPVPSTVPSMQPAPHSARFIPPQIMRAPGLEGLIGSDATALANRFGPPVLDVAEGDARKLQFRGPSCVLDIYLYPLRPEAAPSATWVEARRASDGLDVDRAACVQSLLRR